jgi:hypothetical protein|tara:strand:- start:511 stop:801 length:291 start_codon:yes stop_codon:yes gene_type:complete
MKDDWMRGIPYMKDICDAACDIYLRTGKPVSTLDIMIATDLHPGTILNIAHQAGLTALPDESKEGQSPTLIGEHFNRMYKVRQRTLERYIERGLTE